MQSPMCCMTCANISSRRFKLAERLTLFAYFLFMLSSSASLLGLWNCHGSICIKSEIATCKTECLHLHYVADSLTRTNIVGTADNTCSTSPVESYLEFLNENRRKRLGRIMVCGNLPHVTGRVFACIAFTIFTFTTSITTLPLGSRSGWCLRVAHFPDLPLNLELSQPHVPHLQPLERNLCQRLAPLRNKGLLYGLWEWKLAQRRRA